MDILSIVSNVQQVSPEELEASQQKTNSSARLNNVIRTYTVPVPAHINISIYVLFPYNHSDINLSHTEPQSYAVL